MAKPIVSSGCLYEVRLVGRPEGYPEGVAYRAEDVAADLVDGERGVDGRDLHSRGPEADQGLAVRGPHLGLEGEVLEYLEARTAFEPREGFLGRKVEIDEELGQGEVLVELGG